MILRQEVLATLAYYDVLDMPLTAEEVFNRLVNFRHLPNWKLETGNWKLADVRKELDQLVLDRAISRAGEYYFLFDREYLVPLRVKREKIAKQKWHKTKIAINCLRLIPYVEAVFASGSLAINNTDELSDLDVLIAVKSGRIWLTRFLILGLLSILGMRRKGHDKVAPDKICPNHFITDNSLLIPFCSLYNAQTYSNLVTIYTRQPDLVEKFKKENNWVTDFVFKWSMPNKPLLKNGVPESIVKLAEFILDTKLGHILENLARKLQSQRISSNPTIKQPGGRVIFTDEQLEFHPHSIETEIIKKYNTNLTKLGLSDLAIEHDSGLKK